MAITSGFQPEDEGSIPFTRSKSKKFWLGQSFFGFWRVAGIEQERGRENMSFPGVEVLKPQGFKERSDVRFPSPAQIFLCIIRKNVL